MTLPCKARDFTSFFWTSVVLGTLLPTVITGTPLAQALPRDGATSAAEPRVASNARLTVVVDGFRNDQGRALVALFRKATAFPKEVDQAEQRAEGAIVNGRSQVVFEQVPAGELALSVLHDEDSDRACRLGVFGIPKEGLGFSRNVRARFGPPDFADAKLKVAAGTQLNLAIRVHYYGF